MKYFWLQSDPADIMCIFQTAYVKSTDAGFCGEDYWHCLLGDGQQFVCGACSFFFFLFFFVCDEDLTLFIVWQTTISCFGWIMFKC